MKHNKHSLPFLLACFATAASLAGCTWDSSLYDDFVNKNTDEVMTCTREKGRQEILGITLPNGVYAYKAPSETEEDVYYCGTYDEIATKNPFTECKVYIKNNASLFSDDHDIKSYEDLKNYYKRMTRIPEEGNKYLCPYNSLSCSTWSVPIFHDNSSTQSLTIPFCNACPKDYAMFTPENSGKNITCKSISTCSVNQYYYMDACRDNDTNNCGKHGYVCEDQNAGWADGKCEKGKCVANACQTGYDLQGERCKAKTSCTDPNTHYYYNGTCIPHDIDNCGKHNNKCSTITGWKRGDCTNGVCVPSECQTGYHVVIDNDSKRCVADDSNNCGGVGDEHKCGQGQVCTGGECSDNCGSGEVRCEKDNVVSCADPMTSTTFCGADASCSGYKTCEHGQACVGGECVQNSCTKDNETLCVVNGENMCIDISSDNADHCGACNLKCSDRSMANALSNTCSGGQCQYTCKEGYTNCGTSIVPNCINTANFQNDPNNCGRCGKKCDPDEFCNEGKCIKSTCENQCLSDGTCINKDEKCGVQCTNCNTANNASEGTCNEEGECTITECATGFHLTSDKKCELNTPTKCGSRNSANVSNCIDKSKTHATDAYCNASGQCVATSCETGYHVVKGECVNDSQTACGASATDCTKLLGWKSGKCENGQCKATACDTNYCLNATTCVDGAYNARMCGITGEACLPCDIASGKSCVNGQCVQSRCDENVCFYQGSECSNTNDHCGATCTNCEMIKNAENATCTIDTGLCEITMCQPGYHIKKAAGKHDTCEQNTSEKCAEPSSNDTKKCADELQVSDETKHIQTVDCSPEGTCMITECSTGYHVNDEKSACMEDSKTACGAHDNDCTKLEGVMITEENAVQCLNGKCNATACLKDYHLAGEDNEKKCVQDSPTVCGDSQTNCHEIAHAYEPICRLGTCYVIECEDGYTANNPTGSHGTCKCDNSVCNKDTFKHASSASCDPEDGHCAVVCEKGYARVGNDGPCLCDNDEDAENENSCNIRNFVPATEAQCKPKDETSESELICKITCPNDYPLNASQDACECTENSCDNNIPPDSHIATRSCQDNECVIQSCATHYKENYDNTACVCDSDSCKDIKNATQASCISNECLITCPSDHPTLNSTETACECTSSSSCSTYPNWTCKNGECCRENTSETNIKPNCCSGYTCQQNSSDNPTKYKCVKDSNVDASWPTCPKV